MDSLDFCTSSVYAFKVLGIAIYIIKVVVPIILIVMGVYGLINVTIKKEEAVRGEMITFFKRFIAAFLVFVAPYLIHSIFNVLVDDRGSFDGSKCESCLYKPNGSECKSVEDDYLAAREEEEGEDTDIEGGDIETDEMTGGMGGSVGDGVSKNQPQYVGDDHYKIKIGEREYELYGQNESSIGGETLRDGRSFSNGGCGPTTLASALSVYGYKGNPVEVNKYGSDVTPESHYNAIKNLQKAGKLSSDVQAKCHPKSSLPGSADAFYNQVKQALMEGHDVIMDIREGSKEGQNYCNIYGEGDYFDNEGAVHAHWVTMVGYDTANDYTFFENSCGQRKWFSLRKVMDLTYEAVSGQVFNDEGGWVGSYVEIWT